jgi:8-oxo-dGTP pyrophosphatase MutT (NUDIX family)
MGFPHPTLDIPGSWPIVIEELSRIHLRNEYSDQLERGLQLDPSVIPGHICATAWIFSRTADFVLLVTHRTLGWSTPGGHVERHESSKIAGLRELEEETGLTSFDVQSVLSGPALIHVTDRTGADAHRHWNIAWLYTSDMDAPLSPIEGARWFAVDQLPVGAADLPATVTPLRDLVLQKPAPPQPEIVTN